MALIFLAVPYLPFQVSIACIFNVYSLIVKLHIFLSIP